MTYETEFIKELIQAIKDIELTQNSIFYSLQEHNKKILQQKSTAKKTEQSCFPFCKIKKETGTLKLYEDILIKDPPKNYVDVFDELEDSIIVLKNLALKISIEVDTQEKLINSSITEQKRKK